MSNIKFKFKILGWVETNSFFVPEKANNGGGYSQPEIKILVEERHGAYKFFYNVVTLLDMSCGEFGSRYFLTSAPYGKKPLNKDWSAAWGSMLKDDEKYLSRDIPEEFFIFLETILGKDVGRPTRPILEIFKSLEKFEGVKVDPSLGERDVLSLTILNWGEGEITEEVDKLCIEAGYEPVEDRWVRAMHPEGRYTLHLSHGNRRCDGSTVSYGHYDCNGRKF